MRQAVADLQRQMQNTARIGVVEDTDYENDPPRYRVRLGDIVTGWIPAISQSADGDADTWLIRKGAQVGVSCNGDFNNGFIVGAIASKKNPSASRDPDIRRTVYENGDVVEHNNKTGAFSIQCGGDVTIKAGGNVTIEASSVDIKAPVTQTGGDMTSDGISVQRHTHGQVQQGSGNTGNPQ